MQGAATEIPNGGRRTALAVMIPVTVAGTGLYYTRWQQNLNDLKTMIDLVSDQSPEKRKYGVAMFEYLLKNDKVPVEFVAAQLSYANSSADKELLPLMEQALLKASAENGKVADTFRQALERMPSRVFIHAMNEAQRACLRSLLPRIKDTDSTNITHELRFFRATDKARGEELVNIFRDIGLTLVLQDLSANADVAGKARPNTFELWLGRGNLPASCA
jgi:hypothetical protein